MFHIAALQNEGFQYYDAYRNLIVRNSQIIVALNTADSIAMATWAGTVGHSGKHGCCLFCGFPGRRRPNDGHYYLVMLKPNNYTVAGCDHNDITFEQLHQFQQDIPNRYRSNLELLCSAPNPTQYNARRLETGLCKPSIVMGLKYSLGVPNSFAMDAMHLATLICGWACGKALSSHMVLMLEMYIIGHSEYWLTKFGAVMERQFPCVLGLFQPRLVAPHEIQHSR